MKKVFTLALLAIAVTGYTMAQTAPAPAKKAAKKEAAAPAKATDTTGHHHQKHGKPKHA